MDLPEVGAEAGETPSILLRVAEGREFSAVDLVALAECPGQMEATDITQPTGTVTVAVAVAVQDRTEYFRTPEASGGFRLQE